MTTPSTCWPGEDLDGYSEFFPPQPVFQLYWNATVNDLSKIPSLQIIRVADTFEVRFRLELRGSGWQCMSGDWHFDVAFDEQGGPGDFMLSSKLPADALTVKGWRGCNTSCIEHSYTVPANTIDPAIYRLTARFQLHCCDKPAAIVGFDPLGDWMWYIP